MNGDIPIAPAPRSGRTRRLHRVLGSGVSTGQDDPQPAEAAAAPSPPPAGGPTPDLTAFAQVLQAADPNPPPGAGESAKSTYLKTEWSGRADRRMKPGTVTRTRI